MKAGDVFTLDSQALEELAVFYGVPVTSVSSKLSAGDTFSVSKLHHGSKDFTNASRWVNGKPQKGRPRRFPTATVLRLLGETSSEDYVSADSDSEESHVEEADDFVELGKLANMISEADEEDEDSSW